MYRCIPFCSNRFNQWQKFYQWFIFFQLLFVNVLFLCGSTFIITTNIAKNIT
ncbi:unnamed protein product [Schistosoma margrebowiei]|uniref:Uncharacterized protein n=1 Tax=Schistosoma margrebowiei TaxID=48269 RepID=A0A183LHN0_9TREM|nr:unnamed protein product [Schistosoma margrebowiei]